MSGSEGERWSTETCAASGRSEGEMIDLIGKIVEVGTGDSVYTGTLVEVNEEEVHLESELGWIVVPVDKVAFIREKENE